VLREEMKLKPQNMKRYKPFWQNDITELIGKPYLFTKNTEEPVKQYISVFDEPDPF
jgi:hypothetical protein